ncbi:MAG: RNA 2',3'-cyclic phosphodiesterase [bacterium]|nr:RNA 2',3'-cyclic phosphodiesterase [bacterium]
MRVFSAIKLDNEIIKEINKLLQYLEKYKGIIKIVPPENLHITLRFLGNINQDDYNKFVKRLYEEYSKLKSFSVTIQGIGFFPDRNRIRIVWAGVNHNQELTKVYNIAEHAAREIGLAPEDRFQGHITVGRIRQHISVAKLKDVEDKFNNFIWGKMVVEKVTIFESILHSDGPEYKELIHIQFGG